MTELRLRVIERHGLVDHSFEDDRAPIPLPLYLMPRPDAPPVLLLHGASARLESFLLPEAEGGKARCLAERLHEAGYEPWLLDWRGSNYVAAACVAHEEGAALARRHLDFDRAAAFDLPHAIRRIRRIRGDDARVSTVGHCMGAAVIAQSLAEGFVGGDELGPTVFLTIGLFYSASTESRLKLLDRTLERLYADGGTSVVDPHAEDWRNELETLYREWPRARRAHPARADGAPGDAAEDRGNAICNRVSFMFGSPYREANLEPSIHARHLGEGQFGPMPLRMYLQGTRNLLRGWAGRFDASLSDRSLIDPKAAERFRQLDRFTILTGARNQLWHRDSVDRMWDWLRRAGRLPDGFTRRIFPDYAHQDLLWGRRAHVDVLPTILAGLGGAR